MVYTKARLEFILKVYREEPAPPPRVSKYDFRPQTTKPQYNLAGSCWQSRRRGAKVDDEAYDPKVERRELAAASKRRQKRKAGEDSNGQQTKKGKGNKNKSHNGNPGLVILKITSEAGLQLLRELATIHGTDQLPRQFGSNSGDGLGYGESPRNSATGGRRKKAKYVLGGLEFDTDPLENMSLLTRELRNGKVYKKCFTPSRKRRRRNSIEEPMQQNIEETVIHQPPSTTEHTTSQQGSIESNKTHSEASNEDSTVSRQTTPRLIQNKITTAFSQTTAKPQHILERNDTSLMSKDTQQSLFLPPDSNSSRSDSPQISTGLLTIETNYPHPVKFFHGTHPCNFCTNFRMGVIGLGQKSVSVHINPNNPTQYQETGDGWRAEGYPATTMCISCSLDRLKTMYCHSEQSNQFIRIPNQDNSQENHERYVSDLFDREKRPFKYRNSTGKAEVLLPSCNLCPAAAIWQCYKMQASTTKQIGIPVGSVEKISAGLKVASELHLRSSISMSPFIGTTWTPHRENTKITHEVIDGKEREVICLDDDDDTKDQSNQINLLPPSAKRRKLNDRMPSPVTFPTLSSRISKSARGGSINDSSKRGCGFKLCQRCKVFVDYRCRGGLEESQVRNFLRYQSSFGARADVQWLFKGSELEKTWMMMEGQRRK